MIILGTCINGNKPNMRTLRQLAAHSMACDSPVSVVGERRKTTALIMETINAHTLQTVKPNFNAAWKSDVVSRIDMVARFTKKLNEKEETY